MGETEDELPTVVEDREGAGDAMETNAGVEVMTRLGCCHAQLVVTVEVKSN